MNLEKILEKSISPKAEVVTITPEYASRVLEQNKINPRGGIHENAVIDYAAAMEAGLWQLTGQPIIFDNNGVLLDGFHRMHAAVLSQKSFTTLVVINVGNQVKSDIDAGRPRTIAQRLSLPRHVVDVLTIVAELSGFTSRNCQFVKKTLVETLAETPLGESAKLIVMPKGGNLKYIRMAPFRLGLCMSNLEHGNIDFILDGLDKIRKRQYEDMDKTLQTLCRQIELGNIPRAGRKRDTVLDIAARAFKTFDPRSRNLNIIKISDLEKEHILNRISSYLPRVKQS